MLSHSILTSEGGDEFFILEVLFIVGPHENLITLAEEKARHATCLDDWVYLVWVGGHADPGVLLLDDALQNRNLNLFEASRLDHRPGRVAIRAPADIGLSINSASEVAEEHVALASHFIVLLNELVCIGELLNICHFSINIKRLINTPSTQQYKDRFSFSNF